MSQVGRGWGCSRLEEEVRFWGSQPVTRQRPGRSSQGSCMWGGLRRHFKWGGAKTPSCQPWPSHPISSDRIADTVHVVSLSGQTMLDLIDSPLGHFGLRFSSFLCSSLSPSLFLLSLSCPATLLGPFPSAQAVTHEGIGQSNGGTRGLRLFHERTRDSLGKVQKYFVGAFLLGGCADGWRFRVILQVLGEIPILYISVLPQAPCQSSAQSPWRHLPAPAPHRPSPRSTDSSLILTLLLPVLRVPISFSPPACHSLAPKQPLPAFPMAVSTANVPQF